MWNDEDDATDERWLDIPYVDEDEREEDEADIAGGPGAYDTHLTVDPPFRTVPCSNCGKPVWDEAIGCRRCGHYFSDQAYNDHSGKLARARQRFTMAMVVLIVLAMVLACMAGVRYF